MGWCVHVCGCFGRITADVDYEDVVFRDYEAYNSKLEKEKAERKFDLGKQKKHEAEYTNYIILDPICTTFDP